jgi:hypothetical protein
LLAPTRNVDTSCRCDPKTGLTRAPDGTVPPRHVHGIRLKQASPIKSDLNCRECGMQNQSDAATCYHCGMNL